MVYRSIDRKKKSLENAINNFREFVDSLPEKVLELSQAFIDKVSKLEGRFNKNYTEAVYMGIDVSSYYSQYMEIINEFERKAAITSIGSDEIHPSLEKFRKKKVVEEEQKSSRENNCEIPLYKSRTINSQQMFFGGGNASNYC